MEFLIDLGKNLMGWLLSIFSKERQRTREIKEQLTSLQADITRIRKEGLKKDASDYPLLEKYLSPVIETYVPEHINQLIDNLFKGIPDSLGAEYERVKENLGKLGDRIFIMDVHDYNDNFKQWKANHQEIRNKKYQYTDDLKEALTRCRADVEWIVRKAMKLEGKIDEKIK